MGECGCGDFNGNFKFNGPDGTTYVLQIYPSCENCDTPAGIILYAMSEKECKEWGVEDIPAVDIQDTGTYFSVIHPKRIIEHVVMGIEEYIKDGFGFEFETAVSAAIEENENIHGTRGG